MGQKNNTFMMSFLLSDAQCLFPGVPICRRKKKCFFSPSESKKWMTCQSRSLLRIPEEMKGGYGSLNEGYQV